MNLNSKINHHCSYTRNISKTYPLYTFPSDTFFSYNKMSSFEDVKKAGILILRDNRYMGDEFMDCAMRVCGFCFEGSSIFHENYLLAGKGPNSSIDSKIWPFFNGNEHNSMLIAQITQVSISLLRASLFTSL